MTKHVKPDPQPYGNQANSDSQLPSGRVAFDPRGKAVWEWRTDTGTYQSDVDTQQVKALQDLSGDSLSIDDDAPGSYSANHDPYSKAEPRQPFRASPPPSPEKRPQRRTLDDMRRLSEEIKRQREEQKKAT